jgi:hypothetical protein
MKEWFTIAELRAAGIPTFGEHFFETLNETMKSDLLSSHEARWRRVGACGVDREFHISLFMKGERFALARFYKDLAIDAQIADLEGMLRDRNGRDA